MQLDCQTCSLKIYFGLWFVCSVPVNLVVVPNLHWLLVTKDSHFVTSTIVTNYLNSNAQPTSGLSEVGAKGLAASFKVRQCGNKA